MSDVIDWEGRHHDDSTLITPERAVASLAADNMRLRDAVTGLLADLRAEHYPHPCTDPEDFPCCCQECRQSWPCSIETAARHAEETLSGGERS